MFEKITQGAIHVIMLAHEEAKRMGCDQCLPEHILIGLLGHDGTAAAVMNESGVSLAEARQDFEYLLELPDASLIRTSLF